MIEQLYMTYKQDIYNYLMSLTHDASLSEDLLSETFLSVITSLPQFKGASDIKTWLFSIARYKWYSHLRKQHPLLSPDDLTELYLVDTSTPEIIVSSRDTTYRIHQILGTFDLRSQSIILMRIEGYSFYEISVKHNISESSARVIEFRAKKKLKDQLIKEYIHYV